VQESAVDEVFECVLTVKGRAKDRDALVQKLQSFFDSAEEDLSDSLGTPDEDEVQPTLVVECLNRKWILDGYIKGEELDESPEHTRIVEAIDSLPKDQRKLVLAKLKELSKK
jgi:DNA-directed RNA polymerase specialized sigma24 family protein